MKVLLSAYSCLPGRGSEPGAGWAWTYAATRDHDVWLLTHTANAAVLEPLRAAHPELAARLHPVYLHLDARIERWRRGGPQRFLYYVGWQLLLARRTARTLHARIGFDVAHHVTYASDWLPAGVASNPGLPFVWGPVGGASTLGSPRLWLRLGARAFVAELTRAVALTVLRLTAGRMNARRSSVLLAQNRDVARAFAAIASDVLVEPHVALTAESFPPHIPRDRRTGGAPPTAVYAGRLLAWKGVTLALAALRRPEANGWHLEVYGDGPERARLERLVRRWDLAERVRLCGQRPRAEVGAALARADVLLFPSLHEAAGWVVAEAVAAGCPVVAFDQAGPATLLGRDDGVLVDPCGDVVAGLAAALDLARGLEPPRPHWTADRLPDVIAEVYRRAVGTSSPAAAEVAA